MKLAEKMLTIEEYFARAFECETEFIAGELRPKPLGSPSHSSLCVQLCLLPARLAGRARAFIELNLRIGDDVLIPDVCVLREKKKELPRDAITEPPQLCIEVVSPSQRPAEMLAKCERYHEFGVPFCRVIDPVSKRGREYHSGSAHLEQTISLSAGDLNISLSELFSEE